VAPIRLGEPERRLLLRLIVFLAVLAVVLGATVWVATSDPHGLQGAPAITQSDVPRLEPLYGEINIPWGSLDWSPDGRWIALGGRDSPYEAVILDARTGSVARVLTPSLAQPVEGSFFPGSVRAVRWSPSGLHLAVGASTGWGETGWVHLYSWRGDYEAGWPAMYRDVESIAWSPDGTRLLTAGYGQFAVWESSSHSRLLLAANVSANEAVDWSPDGALLAFGSPKGIQIRNATTATLVLEIPFSGGATWSHDGSRIATAGENGCAGLFRRDGTLLWESSAGLICPAYPRLLRPAWDPADTMVALPTSRGIAIFDAATGKILRFLEFPVDRYGPSNFRGDRGPGTSEDIGVAWSPTGEAIASVGTLSAPSFRMWGVQRSSVAMLSATFEGAVVLGLPLFLFPGSRLWFPLRGRRGFVLPSAALGCLLFLGAFGVTLFQSLHLEFVHRTYDGFAMPSLRWILLTASLSAVTAAPAAALLILVFRNAAGWSPSGQSGRGLQWACGILGLLLLPVLWTTSLGLLVASLIQTAGTRVTAGLLGGILGGFGGLGLMTSSFFYAPFLGVRVKRLTGALLVGTLVSFLTSLGLTAWLAFSGGSLSVLLYGPEIFINGPTVLFGFGLAPFLFGLIALAGAAGVGAALPAVPRWSFALFARLTRERVVDLEARRKVLEYLRNHPGAHFRELLRALGLGSGALHYHLYVLERAGIIVPQRDGMYRRYFPAA
jgi:DNA-binding transcriptional ArsR family regulator